MCKKDKMWAYLMHLSDNMWGDPGSNFRIAPYQPTLLANEDVWKNTIDFLPSQGINTVLIDIGDAIQYERHPEIAVKGAWSKEKLKAELERMRAMGLTPLPKLNFAGGHDAWLGEYRKMISTQIYYQVCRDCIEEVAELFDYPEYFHLGMDEERIDLQDTIMLARVRQGELWWHDVYYLLDVCEKVGTRPWVWADKAWYEPEEFVEKMPKSVLLSNAWYIPFKKLPDGTYDRPELNLFQTFEEHGFDQVPTVSFFNGHVTNAREIMEVGKEKISPEHLLGYMTAPWHRAEDVAKFQLLDDAYRFGKAKEIVYPKE